MINISIQLDSRGRFSLCSLCLGYLQLSDILLELLWLFFQQYIFLNYSILFVLFYIHQRHKHLCFARTIAACCFPSVTGECWVKRILLLCPCSFSYVVSLCSARQTIFDLVGLKYECIIDYLSLDQIHHG